jgi:hypothetical protein
MCWSVISGESELLHEYSGPSHEVVCFVDSAVSLHRRRSISKESAISSGSICIAPPDRSTSGEKSLANPAGGNPISTYAIQVDKRSPVVASNERPVRISSIPTHRKHLVKIIGDGKLVASFRLDFNKYQTKDLCLFFKSLYETWSLWDGKEWRTICKCNEYSTTACNGLAF